MTYEQYWEHDPWLTKYYLEAHQIKNEQKNQEMWVQGRYFYDAVSVVMHNAFRKKSDKEANYPKEPYPLTKHEADSRQARDERMARETAKVKFEVWADTLKTPDEKW